jgi:hypothetical protein
MGLDQHITPSKVPSFKQQKIAFHKRSPEPPLPLYALEVLDNRAEELLMDALIGEAYGDNDILEELMTIQEVFDSVQRLLSHLKQSYAPRTLSDLSLLKQYTAQMLKKGPYYLDKFAASRLVAQSNHITNDGKTLARRIRALFRHYQTFGALPAKTRGGKRKGSSYLDNKDVF